MRFKRLSTVWSKNWPAFGIGLIMFAGAGHAHVTVSPTQSTQGKTETYTFTVPTEGAIATTSVELEVPQDVTIVSVNAPAVEYTATKLGDRVVGISWRLNIPPGGGTKLTLVAKNPMGTGRGIRWKVHQIFADGSRVDWIDPPPSHPAPSTRLMGVP